MTHFKLSFLCVSLSFFCLACQDEQLSNSNDELAEAEVESQESQEESEADSLSGQAEEQSNTEDLDQESVVENNPNEETSTEVLEERESLEETVIFTPLNETEEVVEFVDIERYMGTWYEIATTPSLQQRFCHATTADYSFNETEGWVEVLNSCAVGDVDGRLQEIRGRAEVFDEESQAKLLVFFFDQSSPYWVVELDGSESNEAYQWAVVSVPNKQNMWILSRTAQMDESLRSAIENRLQERGFPIDRLIDTPQP